MQERILARLKEFLARVKDWWAKFSKKQKALIVLAGVAVIVALFILVTALTRPKYETLIVCEDTKEASQVTELLEGEGYEYTISDDGLNIRVLAGQAAEARLLLGANDIQASGYTIEDVTAGGFATTESDKQKRYVVYLASQLEKDFIAKFNAIRTAYVELNIPANDGTLISESRDASAAIVLDLVDEFTPDQAAFLARAVATALGNKDTTNITIMDTDGNMLFSGDDQYSLSGSATTQLSVKAQAEDLVRSEVRQVILNTNLFDQVEVASNLDLDFSVYERTDHTYTAADGQDQGLYAEANEYSSESESGGGLVPGTDSNVENDTTYVFQNNYPATSSTTENSYKYLPNESITKQNRTAGAINYANSSVSVTAIAYNVVREEEARSQGLLDGVSWEQYKAANVGRTKMEVDQDLFSIVANATGIPVASVSILAYEENMFIDRVDSGFGVTDILQILLIVVILMLLAFVVLRSMRRERVVEPEEELSVEDMLQSMPQEEMDELEAEVKSETRKMIEKFVDENPEAAANLLRNWLNEDWA